MRHLFWYSKGMEFFGIGTLLFGLVHDINHSKQVDRKIKEMNAKGAGIWINGKKHPLG